MVGRTNTNIYCLLNNMNTIRILLYYNKINNVHDYNYIVGIIKHKLIRYTTNNCFN